MKTTLLFVGALLALTSIPAHAQKDNSSTELAATYSTNPGIIDTVIIGTSKIWAKIDPPIEYVSGMVTYSANRLPDIGTEVYAVINVSDKDIETIEAYRTGKYLWLQYWQMKGAGFHAEAKDLKRRLSDAGIFSRQDLNELSKAATEAFYRLKETAKYKTAVDAEGKYHLKLPVFQQYYILFNSRNTYTFAIDYLGDPNKRNYLGEDFIF
jgi:hypothetical protein